ncbi:hypothetical protein FN846DRAFT_781016 [Sphaerosporella brunnea]|uniref:GATA-type domain-containing protein n=1 Tax=Sphaerosporella brunnea TaxID=1250544 RepID=A0A5J5ESF0_9PEZI|nr:hypothetical protein FN846DRAFT_781016 [Sphaerosporella brunnea]
MCVLPRGEVLESFDLTIFFLGAAVKVSYSFDEGNKNNCLARWPHLINTPVVQVDRGLLVGAVEFKTCILSIIAGSPELVARLGPDYSVYAYDYSEPDIPLVGCGMLSWAMLNTENSSATRMMVTGRVLSNTFVFLGNNDDVRETLEVKIKLQKVDTFTQEQFVSSVHTYQALSRALPGAFDAAEWSNFLNLNPRALSTALAAPLLPPPPAPQQPRATAQAPHISEPARLVPTLEWKESSASSSEDVVEPPKKKRKVPAKGPKKKDASKSTAGTVPDLEQSQMSDAPLPRKVTKAPKRQSAPPPPQPPPRRSPSRESSVMSQPSLPRQTRVDSISFNAPSEISPSPGPINTMDSSPPAQSDATDAACIPSPAPTSPVLPSLPPPRTEPNNARLETLYEEPETPRVKQEPQPDALQLPQFSQSSSLILPPQPPSPKTNNSFSLPDGAAPCPEPSQFTKVLQKPRKRTRKKDALASDAVASSEIGEEVPAGKRGKEPKAPKQSRTAAHVKARIEMQLIESIKRGEMPCYCQNCGAIETAVWRKVTPPEFQDGTGMAGAVGQLHGKEINLCNACGLWFNTHKTMRPQQLWESNDFEKPKGLASRKRKKSTAPTPPASSLSQALPSDTCTILLEDEDKEATPRAPDVSLRQVAMTPSANRSVKDTDLDWANAISAGRRVACSSPVIHGSAESPIDLEGDVDGMPSPKRTLFPEARKSSPEHPVGLPMPKRGPGKENQSPPTPTAAAPPPSTPTKRVPAMQHLRTPLRSASKQGTPRTVAPETPSRRLVKSPERRGQTMSPVAGLLEKLLAEDPSVLADINAIANSIPFDIDDVDTDFLNTDYTMPSSPLPSSPPMGFGMYSEQEWEGFLPSTPNGANGLGEEVSGAAVQGRGMTVDLSAFIEEHTTSGGLAPPREVADVTAEEQRVE